VAPEPHTSDTVKVGRSPIEGLGLFATREFQPGEPIRRIHVVREITIAAPLREEIGERADHCDYPDGRVVLLGFPDRHLNHSCDPNAWIRYEGERCWIVARRNIGTGDEITCDYNINITGGTSWPCHCGATRCTGTVEGDFFRLPRAIRLEYRPILAEWFVHRHGARLKELHESRPLSQAPD
jgi:hypothetical protein